MKQILKLIFLFSVFSQIIGQWDLQDYGIIVPPQIDAKYYYGTYKPNLYFSVTNRLNYTNVIGLMWYNNDNESNIDSSFIEKLRHNVNVTNNVEFDYEIHNGLDYAREVIKDKEAGLEFTAELIKAENSMQKQRYAVLIKGHSSKMVGFILYNSIENTEKATYLTINENNQNGQSVISSNNYEDNYVISVLTKGDIKSKSKQSFKRKSGLVWQIKSIIAKELDKIFSKTKDNYPIFENNSVNLPNIYAEQLIIEGDFEIILYLNTSPSPTNDRPIITDSVISELTQLKTQKEQQFLEKIKTLFPIKDQEKDKIIKEKLILNVISNTLGNIGYSYGKYKVNIEENPENGYVPGFRYAVDAKDFYYTTPSRHLSRGQLMSEGLSQILIAQIDKDLTIQILNNWLSTMSSTGYLAKEQIRGKEIESLFPKNEIEQNKNIPNPPTFIFVIDYLLNYYKFNYESAESKYLKSFLNKCHDKISLLFEWFDASQKAPGDKNAYQWFGRSINSNSASGLDDYPRGILTNIYEKHVDLHIWIIELTRTLRDLSELFDVENVEYFQSKLQKMNEFVQKNLIASEGLMTDYLGHQFTLIDSADKTHKVPPYFWRNDNKCGNDFLNAFNQPAICNPYSDSPCCNTNTGTCGNGAPFCHCKKCSRAEKLDEKLKKEKSFSPHHGVINLFGLMFGYIQEDDEVFSSTLQMVENELLSNFGLRSLSKNDILYSTSAKYRGNISIWINYFVLRGLNKYYKENERAQNLYRNIKEKLERTVLDEFKLRNKVFEFYSAENGKGITEFENVSPGLIVNIILEDYQ